MLDFYASRTFYIWRRKRDLNPLFFVKIDVDTYFDFSRVHFV